MLWHLLQLAKSCFLQSLLLLPFNSARVGAAQSLLIVQDFIAVMMINDYLHWAFNEYLHFFFCLFVNWVVKESQMISWIYSTIGTSTGISLFRARLMTWHVWAATHHCRCHQSSAMQRDRRALSCADSTFSLSVGRSSCSLVPLGHWSDTLKCKQ